LKSCFSEQEKLDLRSIFVPKSKTLLVSEIDEQQKVLFWQKKLRIIFRYQRAIVHF
jgi:hypothetical protein